MKRCILLPIVMVLVSFFVICAIADAESKEFVKVQYSSNIRSGPSTDEEKLGSVDEGAVFELVEKLDGWYHIKLSDGRDAYIGESRCKVIASAETIAIESEYTTVPAGGSVTLQAIVGPDNAEDKSVIWSSSDESIATVNSKGKVTGVMRGEVDIIATAAAGDNITTSWHITVVQPVKTINVTGPTKLVPVGYGVKLEAEVLPEDAEIKELNWSSSNEKIAVVIDGYVYGIGKGSCTITAISTDGAEVKGKYSVEVKQYDAVLIARNDTAQLTYKGISGGGIFSINYYSDNGCVNVSSNGGNTIYLSAVKNGEDTVTVTVQELFSRRTTREKFRVLVGIDMYEDSSMMNQRKMEAEQRRNSENDDAQNVDNDNVVEELPEESQNSGVLSTQ